MSSTAVSAPPGEPPAAPPKARGRILPAPVTGQEMVLVGVIAVLWIALALATPAFLTTGSIVPLLVSTAPVALAGVGMTIISITGKSYRLRNKNKESEGRRSTADDQRLSPPEDTDRNWRCLLFHFVAIPHPGGQVKPRPAHTCRWRWKTDCCAPGPP